MREKEKGRKLVNYDKNSINMQSTKGIINLLYGQSPFNLQIRVLFYLQLFFSSKKRGQSKAM